MPKGDKAILKADPLDGTTPIANLLLEALAMAHLSGREKGAIILLWRKTYGWQKGGVRLKEYHITLRQWAEGLNITESNASRVITRLVTHNIIQQTSLGQGKGYIYSMNTNIAKWNGNCINQQALLRLTTLVENDNPCRKVVATLVENDKTTLVENDKTTLVENDNPIMPTKETLNKHLNKSSTSTSSKTEEEDDFLSLYKNNFGEIKPFNADTLNKLADKYSPAIVYKAITEAIKRENKKINYIEAIADGIAMDEKWEKNKNE